MKGLYRDELDNIHGFLSMSPYILGWCIRFSRLERVIWKLHQVGMGLVITFI